MDCTSNKAALYIRVSTEEQAVEGQSADAQLETLKQYCTLYGIEIYKVYKDLGLSGKSAANRPGLLQMMQDASNKRFNMVLVWKISRLSRSLKDLLLIIEQLEKNSIVFCSYSERFDTSNAVGRMTLQLLGSIAEFERNTILDNVKLGLTEYARKGGKTGTVLGYDNVNKQLVVNKSEAEIVRVIFELYADYKMSMSDIADYLNQRYCKTKRNRNFRKDSISVILSNPVYIGINRHKVNSPDEYQTIGSHEPIIDENLWHRANELRASNIRRRSKRSGDTSFILSGRLICAECEVPMHGFSTSTASKVYRYYKCPSCRKLLKTNPLDIKVLDILYLLLQNEAIVKDTMKALNSHHEISTPKMHLQSIQNEVHSLEKLLDRYLLLSENDAFKEGSVILDRIMQISERLKKLRSERNELLQAALTDNSFNEACYDKALNRVFNGGCVSIQKQIVELAIRHIYINKDSSTGTIYFSFPVGADSKLNFDL